VSAPVYIHANALVVGETGVLLRGPSGAGKSMLTLELVALAQAQGQFARLVGDDRVSIEADNGRLIARPHPAIAGLIEKRAYGVEKVPFAAACVLRLVIDLLARDAGAERIAQEPDLSTQLAGLTLPRRVEYAQNIGGGARILSYIQQFATN